MPNGFRPTKAPGEKPPFPDRQIVSGLATVLAVVYDEAAALGRRWCQVRTPTGKEAGVWMGVEPHQKPP